MKTRNNALPTKAVDEKEETHIKIIAERIVFQYSRPAHEAEDIAQELRQALVRALPNYKPEEASYSTFAQKVIRNKACDLIRRFGSGVEVATILDAPADPKQPDCALVETIPDPDEMFERWRNVHDVRAILARLTDTERDVSALLMEGVPKNEIAKRLGITRWHFWRTLYPGIVRKFRRLLGEKPDCRVPGRG